MIILCTTFALFHLMITSASFTVVFTTHYIAAALWFPWIISFTIFYFISCNALFQLEFIFILRIIAFTYIKTIGKEQGDK